MPLYLALIYSCNSVPELVSPSLCIFLDQPLIIIPPPHFPWDFLKPDWGQRPSFSRHNEGTPALKNGTLWQFPNLFRYTQIPSQCSRREIYRRAKHKSYANKNTSQNSQRYQNSVVSVAAVCQIWLNEYFHQGFWLILPSFTFTDQVFPGGTDRKKRLIRILNPRLEWEEVVNLGSTATRGLT